MTFRVYPTALIEENKWRAVRYGLDGKLIDLGKQEELPTRTLIRELIEWFLGDVLDELGTPQGGRVRLSHSGRRQQRRPAGQGLRADRRHRRPWSITWSARRGRGSWNKKEPRSAAERRVRTMCSDRTHLRPHSSGWSSEVIMTKLKRRSSGILLHPTSLPGRYRNRRSSVRWPTLGSRRLPRAKQTWWQVLPLGPTGYGDSPVPELFGVRGQPESRSAPTCSFRTA